MRPGPGQLGPEGRPDGPWTIAYVFGWPLGLGGHFRSALAMIKCLLRQGHRIVVAASWGDGGYEEAFSEAGAQVVAMPPLNTSARIPSPAGALRIAEIARNMGVDIIHAQDWFSVGPGYMAAVMTGKALVVTQAGGPFHYHRPPRGVDLVVFSEELVHATIAEYGLDRECLHLVRGRISMDDYFPSRTPDAFVARHRLPTDGYRIVMAVRLVASKRPFLESVFRLAEGGLLAGRDLRIVVAGDGPLLGELVERAKRANGGRTSGPLVRMVGPIRATEEINYLYNYADLVVGSGRGILEAMACRRPVLLLGERGEAATIGQENVAEMAYFNFSGRHFRMRPCGTQSLGALVTRLLDSPRLCRELSEFSYEYVRTEMGSAVGASQLARTYRLSLARRHGLGGYACWVAQETAGRARLSLRGKLETVAGSLGLHRPNGTVPVGLGGDPE